jgi:ribosomal protein S18
MTPFPTVLLIAGLVFILLAILDTFRIKDWEGTVKNKRMRLALFALGVLLVVAAFVLYLRDKESPPNKADPVAVSTPVASPIVSGTPAPPVTISTSPSLPQPELLIIIIKREQHDNVRESYGEQRGQNFSEEDFARFVKEGKVADITVHLKTDREFLDVVLAIKRMPASDRQKLLDKGSSTHKQTWSEIGKISPEGQTDAGQKAERKIAEAIVNLVKELSSLSDEAIRKLQTG